MGRVDCCRLLLPILLLAPAIAHAQAAPGAPTDVQQRADVERQLQELARSRQELSTMQQNLQKQMADFDARIAALEAKLGVAPAQDAVTPANDAQTNDAVAQAVTQANDALTPADEAAARLPPPSAEAEAGGEGQADAGQSASEKKPGTLQPGQGIILVEGKDGGLAFGINGYVRYLNQGGLNSQIYGLVWPDISDRQAARFSAEPASDQLPGMVVR